MFAASEIYTLTPSKPNLVPFDVEVGEKANEEGQI